jgi:hypothetical protein
MRTLFSCLTAVLMLCPVTEARAQEGTTLTGHSSSVNSIAFSPDGRTIASGSDDNTIKLWDATSGSNIRTLTGHDADVLSVAFSSDGRTIASASDDYTIKLWDAASGSNIRTLTGHSGWVYSVPFSPDGRTIASGSGDNTIKLWDAASGSNIRTLTGHSDFVRSVAFSPDGRTIASGSRDKTIKLWDAASGSNIRTLTGHSESVYSVAFSPDGRTIASGSPDKTIKLWDAASGSIIKTLTGHSNWIYAVAFSPDGRTIASGGRDETIRLWRIGPSAKMVRSVQAALRYLSFYDGPVDGNFRTTTKRGLERWLDGAGLPRNTSIDSDLVVRLNAAVDQLKVALARSVQDSLKALGLYDGAIDGNIGPGTRRGLNTWLTSAGLPTSTNIDLELIARLSAAVELHGQQLAREEQQRKEAQARAEEEARQRRLNDPDYKLFVKLKPQAEELMAQVRGFLDQNPSGDISVPAALGIAQVEDTLSRESGEALSVALEELGAVVESSEQFTSFRTALLQAGQRETLRNDALVKSELAALQNAFIRLLSSKGAPSSVLAPLIRQSEKGRTASSAVDRASALTELKAKVAQNKTVSEAAAGIEKEAAERRVTVRKEENQDAVAVIIGNKTYQNGVPEVSYAHNDASAIKAYLINTLGYSERNVIDLRDTSQADLIGMFGTDDNYRGRLFGMVRAGRSDVTVFYSGHGVPGIQDKRGYLLPVNADPDLVELNGYPIDRLCLTSAPMEQISGIV